MIELLLLAQKGMTFQQWLNLNPFAGILLITFALMALVTLVRSRWLDGPEAEETQATLPPPKAPTKAPAKEEAPVKVKAETKAEEPAETKTEEPKKQKQKQKQKPKKQKQKQKKEPEVAAPVEETPEETAPEPAAEVEAPVKDETPAKDETPIAEEAPAEEPAKEPVKDEEEPPVAEEVPQEEPPKEEPKEEPKELSEDAKARQKKLEERQKKRTMHVSEVKFKDDTPVEPRSLRDGLERTRKGWISKLGDLLKGKKELDDDVLEDLEEILYSADIGTRTVQRLLGTIEEKLERDELNDPSKVKDAIKDEIYKILDIDKEPLDFTGESPFVVMVVGVNGVGKTTTIGKVAARLNSDGKKVLVGAADTFRAAAVEQLELWAERTDAEVIKGKDGQDPSSVVFDAVQAGVAREVDVVLADTAGRLHTNQNLMQELKKIKRVMGRACASSPHEVLLVLDATTGQNAINQAKEFNEALGVTGIALTKLDGSAKGGVVVAICEELKIPIRFVGVGEHIDELKRFSPSEFVDALF